MEMWKLMYVFGEDFEVLLEMRAYWSGCDLFTWFYSHVFLGGFTEASLE